MRIYFFAVSMLLFLSFSSFGEELKNLSVKEARAAAHKCVQGDAPACADLWVNYLDKSKFPKSDPAFSKKECTIFHKKKCNGKATFMDLKCKAGEGTFCFQLAMLYAEGFDVKKSGEKSKQLLDQACALKMARACPVSEKDLQRMVTECSAAIDEACSALYYTNYTGREVQAASIYAKACDLGSKHACLGKAEYLETTEAGKKKSFERACELGAGDGCVQLALYSYSPRTDLGKVLAPAKVEKLLTRACDELKFSAACWMLHENYRDGNGVAKSKEKANRYLLASCTLIKDFSACGALGKENGK